MRQKVIRGSLTTIVGGKHSKRSGKQPVSPAEPWRPSGDHKGDMWKTNVLFEKLRTDITPSTLSFHPDHLYPDSCSEGNSAILFVTIC